MHGVLACKEEIKEFHGSWLVTWSHSVLFFLGFPLTTMIRYQNHTN